MKHALKKGRSKKKTKPLRFYWPQDSLIYVTKDLSLKKTPMQPVWTKPKKRAKPSTARSAIQGHLYTSKKAHVMYLLPIVLLVVSLILYMHPIFTTASDDDLLSSAMPIQLYDTNALQNDERNNNDTTPFGSDSLSKEAPFIRDMHVSEADIETIENLDLKREEIPLRDIGEFVDEEEDDVDVNKLNPYESALDLMPPHQKVRDFVEYFVKDGDTLWLIAKQFKVSIDSIVSANNMQFIHHLRIGTPLRIPPYSGLFYTVQPGDNLPSIAQKHQISLNEIDKYNDLQDYLSAGTVLFLNGARYGRSVRNRLFGKLFSLPLSESTLSSKYGMRKHPIKKTRLFHTGVDLAVNHGTEVKSAASGKVIFSGKKGGYGEMIEIKHAYGYSTVYAHLSRRYVKKGQRVRREQPIGKVGNTGISTGPHLHFEIKSQGKYVNPKRFLRF